MARQLTLDLALPPPTYAREDFVVAPGNREALAWIERWPDWRPFAVLGEVSYALFLTHFPLVLLANALFVRLGWVTPAAAVFGILATWTASIGVAMLFFRYVETPAGRLLAGRRDQSASSARLR